MISIKTKLSKKKIKPEDYVNKETGETLGSEMGTASNINAYYTQDKDSNTVVVTSREYVIIDSESMRFLEKHCKPVDMAKIYKMSRMVSGDLNLLHDVSNNKHTPATLRGALDYDEAEFSRFMNRLLKKSVIYYLIGYKDGNKCKWIMLNPFIARRGKLFNKKECLSKFVDYRKDGKQLDESFTQLYKEEKEADKIKSNKKLTVQA